MTWNRSPALVLFVLGLGLFLTDCLAAADKEAAWGTVKGQVIFGGKELPKPKEIDVSNNQDKQHCLSKGPLLSQEWTVNKDNKGVRWTFVWLAPTQAGETLPVHPSLKEVKNKEVEIDQPCCMFIPHALGLRQGQDIVAKNSSPVSHSINWAGLKNGGDNVIVPSSKSHTITKLVPERAALKVSCTIHPWMTAWVRIFDHPYFAVTDENGKFEIKLAPAGEYRLCSWHEAVGYGPGGNKGVPVTIKGNADNDAGKLELKPADSN